MGSYEIDPWPDLTLWGSLDTPPPHDPKETPQSYRAASQWPPKARLPWPGSHRASGQTQLAPRHFLLPSSRLLSRLAHPRPTPDETYLPSPLPHSIAPISLSPSLGSTHPKRVERKVRLISVLN